jgi:hypothetical protein
MESYLITKLKTLLKYTGDPEDFSVHKPNMRKVMEAVRSDSPNLRKLSAALICLLCKNYHYFNKLRNRDYLEVVGDRAYFNFNENPSIHLIAKSLNPPLPRFPLNPIFFSIYKSSNLYKKQKVMGFDELDLEDILRERRFQSLPDYKENLLFIKVNKNWNRGKKKFRIKMSREFSIPKRNRNREEEILELDDVDDEKQLFALSIYDKAAMLRDNRPEEPKKRKRKKKRADGKIDQVGKFMERIYRKKSRRVALSVQEKAASLSRKSGFHERFPRKVHVKSAMRKSRQKTTDEPEGEDVKYKPLEKRVGNYFEADSKEIQKVKRKKGKRYETGLNFFMKKKREPRKKRSDPIQSTNKRERKIPMYHTPQLEQISPKKLDSKSIGSRRRSRKKSSIKAKLSQNTVFRSSNNYNRLSKKLESSSFTNHVLPKERYIYSTSVLQNESSFNASLRHSQDRQRYGRFKNFIQNSRHYLSSKLSNGRRDRLKLSYDLSGDNEFENRVEFFGNSQDFLRRYQSNSIRPRDSYYG